MITVIGLLLLVIHSGIAANDLTLRQLIRKAYIQATVKGALISSAIAKYETVTSSNIPVISYLMFINISIICYL